MDTTGIAIFKQICEVNNLDPEQVRKKAKEQDDRQKEDDEGAEFLIRVAFNLKAKQLIKGLDLGSTSGSESITEGEEYSISPDPAAPSFTINEEFINSKYSEGEAAKLIGALGKIMLPIRA